jgi:hypothetical protein
MEGRTGGGVEVCERAGQLKLKLEVEEKDVQPSHHPSKLQPPQKPSTPS